MRTFLEHCWRILTNLVLLGIAVSALVLLIRHITSPLNPHYMKPTTFFVMIAIGLIGIIALGACANMDNRTSTEYSLIRDLTDSTIVLPNEDEIITDLDIKTNIWNGINFNFFNVSDVSYTPHWRIVLVKGGKRIASSEFSRKREINTFKARLSALLDSAQSDIPGRTHSSIYIPIVEELTRMSNSNADRKVLVVYSDLMENTQDISFYNSRTFAELGSNPEKVKAKLLAEAKLPNLSGISIHFVHEPKNAKDDANFRRVSELFRQMFEAQGAEVTISANLVKT